MDVIEKIVRINSENLSKAITIGCLVPKQIDRSLILLHGYDGTYGAMKNNLSLETYAAEHNLLIVIPNTDNGYYIDRENYLISTFIARELLQFLRNEFQMKESNDILLGGSSMGGYGALLIGAKYPNVFRKILCISAAFIQNDVTIGNPEVVGAHQNREVVKYFEKTFGPFLTLENSARRNPFAAITKIKDEDSKPQIIITCGTEDMLYIRNEKAVQCIRENGLECDFYPIENGLHDYECFKKGLNYAMNKVEMKRKEKNNEDSCNTRCSLKASDFSSGFCTYERRNS